MSAAQKNHLPAEPLAALIREDAAREWDAMMDRDRGGLPGTPGLSILARRTNIAERSLYRVLRSENVTDQLADEYCCRTGRHLSEVYPELYADADPEEAPDGAFDGECRYCSHRWLHVKGEGRRRLWLVCCACSRGQFLHAAGYEHGGGTRQPPREIELCARLYQSGYTLDEVALETGIPSSTVARRVRAAGVAVRDRGALRPETRSARLADLARARVARVQTGRWREQRAFELRQEGLTFAEIASAIGVETTSGAHAAWRRAAARARAEVAA